MAEPELSEKKAAGIAAGVALLILSALIYAAPAKEKSKPYSVLHKPLFKLEVAATDLEHPWGMAQLPDGGWLITERAGRLRRLSSEGKLSEPLGGVPAVFAEGQGGLLDVALDPDYATNGLIYLSYAEAEGELAGTAVARAKLVGDRLKSLQVVFRQQPKVKGNAHWGSRLVFGRDGTLFITLGERAAYSESAQDLRTHLGKIIRIWPDGRTPKDNPFVKDEGALPEIWTYGHRNSQGAALHPDTGELWEVEHGPRGGDELNRIIRSTNYGWPEVCYGSHYDGTDIPDDHAARGFIEPKHFWTPSIAPSGLIFYTGDAFPEWRGDAFVGALAGMSLVRLDIDNGEVVKEERMLTQLNARIRDIEQARDGTIYVLTDDANGQLLRLSPR